MNTQFEIEDDYPVRNWKLTESAWFRRTKDPLGDLSNFAVGMPIRIRGFEVRSSEHLYQAMRFPHLPDVQFQILYADTPKMCKTIAREYDGDTRGDWTEIRVGVMRWVLAGKILANIGRMQQMFDLSDDKPIVEFSTRDSFWGAAPEWDGSETLVGRNVLGCLLTELRSEFQKDRLLGCSARPAFPMAVLLSRPI
ncbi:MAG: hypothetical protein RLZZ436_3796 [Planctomycetota bacterium]|jgi:ribA/ribD-fused uncharacterized protein